MNAVVVEKVSKKYGDVIALDDVSLSVREGEIFGLLGPNGAGKTTLMEIIVGLRRPDSGKVILLGTDVTKKSNEIKLLEEYRDMLWEQVKKELMYQDMAEKTG